MVSSVPSATFESCPPTMSSTSNGGDLTTPSGSEDVYKELTHFFATHAGQVLEIEVLPSAFPLPPGTTSTILQDGASLGITKKALVEAFLVARHVVFNCLKQSEMSERDVEEVLLATGVLLLFDPEYLTAANFRKRRLLSLGTLSCDGTSKKLMIAVNNEMVFLETLLTSPLHRHTKSPTLWHHRWWLVQTYFTQVCQAHCIAPSGQGNSDAETVWTTEVEVVMRAGDRHPKNYYAWAYARRLYEFLSQKTPKAQSGLRPSQFLADCSAFLILGWCLSHPTDISGWSFLLFLLQKLNHEPERQRAIFDQVWSFTCRFTWWGEALWWFLRTVLAMEGILPAKMRAEHVQNISDGIQRRKESQVLADEGSITAPLDATGTDVVKKAVLFCKNYGRYEDIPVEP